MRSCGLLRDGNNKRGVYTSSGLNLTHITCVCVCKASSPKQRSKRKSRWCGCAVCCWQIRQAGAFCVCALGCFLSRLSVIS